MNSIGPENQNRSSIREEFLRFAQKHNEALMRVATKASRIMPAEQKTAIYRQISADMSAGGLEKILSEVGINSFCLSAVSGMHMHRIAITDHSDFDMSLNVNVDNNEQFRKAFDVLANSRIYQTVVISPNSNVIRFRTSEKIDRLGVKDTIDMLIGTMRPSDNNYPLTHLLLLYDHYLSEIWGRSNLLLCRDFSVDNEISMLERSFQGYFGDRFEERMMRELKGLYFDDASVDIYHLTNQGGLKEENLLSDVPSAKLAPQILEAFDLASIGLYAKVLNNDLQDYQNRMEHDISFDVAPHKRQFNMNCAHAFFGNFAFASDVLTRYKALISAVNVQSAYNEYMGKASIVRQRDLLVNILNNTQFGFAKLAGNMTAAMFFPEHVLQIKGMFGVPHYYLVAALATIDHALRNSSSDMGNIS